MARSAGNGVENVTISQNSFVRHSSGAIILQRNVKDVTITDNCFVVYMPEQTPPDRITTPQSRRRSSVRLGLVPVFTGKSR